MKTAIILSALILVASASITRLSFTTIKDLFPNGRIIGGQVANEGKFPYIVHLSATIGGRSWTCGGSIISDRWILTAAHCTHGASSFNIIAGSNTLNPLQSTAQIRTAGQIIVHLEYNPVTLENDISLIGLSEPLELNSKVWPIPLITPQEGEINWTGQIVKAAGWGKTADNAGSSLQLRYVEMRIEDQNTCEVAYPAGTVNEGVICANTEYGTRSTCQGDSGGPLVLLSGRLIGITSFVSLAGCQSGYPAGFVRVSYYLPWIRQYSGV